MAAAPQTEQLFLSYSRNDREAAVALRNELEKAGFSVFRDEDSIRAGDNWMQRLQDALQSCTVLTNRDLEMSRHVWRMGYDYTVEVSGNLSF